MPLLGAHMSIAGGYYKAVDAAAALGMETVQIFTKNNNQWRGKPLVPEDVRLFRDALDRTGVQRPCAHNSYLINVGSADQVLWQRSVDALVDEVERAEAFGLEGIVMHPGAAVGATEEEALTRIVQGINETHRRTPKARSQLWLEATAGQGSCLGCWFEHLAYIINEVDESERLGVCIDTCHIFAAGYPIGSTKEFATTFQKLDEVVGLDRIRAFHVNDSKKPLGSRVDRHEHIGEGLIGLEPFRMLLNDQRFEKLPMYLETKKEQRDGEKMDAVNLRTLRGLISTKKPATIAPPSEESEAGRSMNASPRVSGWMMLVVVVVAIGARAAACVAYPQNLRDDRDVYLAMASGLREGRGLSSPESAKPTAFRPPLYPLLLAPISWPDQVVPRATLHCVLAAGMVLAVFWLARLSGLSPGRQIVAGLLVALDPLLVYYSTLPMTETLAAAGSALLLAAGTAACRAMEVRQRTIFSALGAVAFGVCVMTRPTYWAFAACVAVFGVGQELWGARHPERHKPRVLDWVIGGVLAIALVAPWVVRNWLVMGWPILTTTHGGYTLLLGNNEAYYDEVVRQPLGTVWDGSRGPGQQAWAAKMVDEMRAAGVDGELASDQWMKERAWKAIRARPGTFLLACGKRFVSFWSVRAHADTASTAGRVLSAVTAIYYTVLWSALLWSAWSAIRQGGCAVELSLLLIAAFVLVHLVYWTDARMRAPVMPAIAVLVAGAGFQRRGERLRTLQ